MLLKVRSWIILGYLVSLGMLLLLGILVFIDMGWVKTRLDHVEAADDLTAIVLDARRGEKNYLLYRDAGDREEVDRGLDRLDGAAAALESAIDQGPRRAGVSELARSRGEYRAAWKALVAILAADPRQSIGAPAVEKAVERTREAGRLLQETTREVSSRERAGIADILRNSRVLLVLAFLLTTGMAVAIGYAVSSRIVSPLRRLEETTKRVAKGDFSPVPPGVEPGELESLVRAFNMMTKEIESRQEQLVQARKLASVGTLTSGVAHELNNPLSNILTTVQRLREEEADLSPGERDRLLNLAERETGRATEIVRKLLDFAREQPAERTIQSVSGLVAEAVELVRNQAAIQGVDVEIRVPAGVPEVLVARGEIQQVLVNLFLNAIQAMPDGGTLSVEARRGQDSFVEIAVRDTGRGIPPEHLDRIFDPFFTTKGVREGTGLGLSVSYGIVRRHGGTILVQSEVGKGSTLTVRLPAGGGS